MLEARDGNRLAAVAFEPSEGGAVGVVVVPDAYGLSPYYEEVARRLADEGGHASLAIDFLGRTAGVGRDRPESFPAPEHVAQVSDAAFQADIGAGVAHLRSLGGSAPRALVTLGFCIGGRHAILAAAEEHHLAGAIGFYGILTGSVDSPGPIQRADRLTVPILAVMAGADEHISAADVAEFEHALAQAGVEHEVVTYPGLPHGFMRRAAERFPRECEDAWRRVLDFLARVSRASAGT